ncbi:MAG: ATP-binding protein [Helicobacteraceae bacterium]|nr:ATP-binding protein [Helicobacteraceae bacterium]
MEYISDFIQTQAITKTKLYPLLKCSVKEAKILRHFCLELLGGVEEIKCIDVIEAIFNPLDEVEVLKYLPLFKNLIESGFLIECGFLKEYKDCENILEIISMNLSLGNNFFKLLNHTKQKPLEIKPYTDHLEYLKDQFLSIEILRELRPYKKDNNKALINKGMQKYKQHTEYINKRVKLTKESLPLEKFFKENDLNQQEKIIFTALLREEYLNRDGNGREISTLIDLISQNDYERMKNRSILDDKGNLISKGLIDYDEILSTFSGVSRSFFIPDEILKQITHAKQKEAITLKTLVEEQEIFELIEPKTSLDEVVLNKNERETLEIILRQMDSKVLQRLKKWGINKDNTISAKIIFYGPPGTGKTITALALAKSLKKEILSFDCSKILSMYVGESEKNVRKIFDTYKAIKEESKQEPILLLDEADQFLSTRTTSGSGADKMHNQMQNIFLEQIEKFSGILIATTNLLETLDTAFARRFNYKIEFKRPNLDQRLKLWEKLLPKGAPFSKNFDINSLAKHSLSGGQISLVIKNTAYKIAALKKPEFSTQSFLEEIKKELESNFDNTREMGFNT